MQKVVSSRIKTKKRASASFTLIELLTVIAIISILATLVLAAASGLEAAAARKRATSEISGLSIALENYKTDNGVYPPAYAPNSPPGSDSVLLGPPSANYIDFDPSIAGGAYQNASETLYTALSGGQTMFTSTVAPTGKAYFAFTKKQVGSPTFNTYVQDPWGYAYGYSTGDAKTPQQQYPFRGSGFFDLWSTGGATTAGTSTTTGTNTWIVNWQ
jgi:prepilin-type N-terminal cleavage/methylation domain-containing protein